jgi:L-fuculose-phosphate aldolase
MKFEQARRDLIAASLELARRGYLAGTGGNLACRVDDRHFAVTPSATDYFTMTPEDICVLRLDNLEHVEGGRRPSIEHRLHAYVLRARRDCRASIHTHQPIASAYTLLGRALPIHDPRHRMALGDAAVLVGYAPSGTRWLASKLRKALRPGINAYLMRNHGVVCCAPTLGEAVAGVEALEAACAGFFVEAIGSRAGADRSASLSGVLELLTNPEVMEPVR